jgi:hypothetical protein
MAKKPDYETSYIEGPKGELQETHLDSRDMLNRVRDYFDIPMSAFFAQGSPENGILKFSEYGFEECRANVDEYIIDGVLDLYTLLLNTIPAYFELAIQAAIFDKSVGSRVFEIAGSEGIDTAVSYVMDAIPFSSQVLASGNLHQDNSRFRNDGISHPETGEKLYKICPGFRLAKSIERQIVRTVGLIISEYSNEIKSIDTTIPNLGSNSIGERCREVVCGL